MRTFGGHIRASRWVPEGLRFKSVRPDHFNQRSRPHGKGEEENRKESQGRPHAAERAQQVTLTRSQLHERISDLSGMYKAAQENKRLTVQKRAEDERLADLARQADEKADGHLLEIAAQIREAQQEYAAAVEELIAVPNLPIAIEDGAAEGMPPEQWEKPVGFAGFNSVFSEPADFQAQALENGLARIHDAFDRSTHG